MASANRDCRVIGFAGKLKHERNIMDSRASITAYRTGTVGGSTGPTIILLKGTKLRRGYVTIFILQIWYYTASSYICVWCLHNYSDTFLRKYGLANGSTIIMTPNAFMTTEAWSAMIPHLLKGYRVNENMTHDSRLKTHESKLRTQYNVHTNTYIYHPYSTKTT